MGPTKRSSSSWFSPVIVFAAVGLSYIALATSWPGRLTAAWGALQELRHLPQDQIDDFFAAYERLETMPPGMPTEADKKAVHDYYRVLHRVLTAGIVMEIMLVPPVIDRHAGILGNLELWQRRMTDRLLVKPGDTLLDTGCGRGRIAFNVASWSNASVVGVNIDESQVAFARSLARDAGMEAQLQFVEQDYNEPFRFLANASVDGHYCAQACMFVNDKRKFMAESARVLKPGARFYGLEWVQLPAFDAQNATQADLVQRSATILGTSMPGPISAWTDAFSANGFRVLYVGHPTPHNSLALLEDINAVYAPLQGVMTLMGQTGLVSQRLVRLFERLRVNWDALVTMMRMELATPTYEFVAEKL